MPCWRRHAHWSSPPTQGDAGFYGSEGGDNAFAPFVGIAPTADERGYWIANAFGTVCNFGDAPSEPPLADGLVAPAVGITADRADRADPKASGYWLVAADGGVFSFGGARF